MNFNLKSNPPMQTTYNHPWYSQLQLLENSTTCDAELTQKQSQEILGQQPTKQCVKCGEHLPHSAFYRNSAKRDKLNPYCIECTKADTKLRDRLRAENPMPDACQCCGSTDRRLVLDHDHETNTFRGYICHHCNTGIGCFNDDPTQIQQAIHYLTNAVQQEEEG